jgi:hypothetical protein
MLRFSEIGLFLVPFALFATWRILGPRTPRSLVWAALVLTAAMGVGTVWYGLERRLDTDEDYVPAHIENGRLVPGHGVPRTTP